MGQSTQHTEPLNMREALRQVVAHLEHVLPGQAPIKDFVHHNTLHGFEHLPFAEALEKARGLTGAEGYLPEAQFRAFYRDGRITREDLDAVLSEDAELRADEVIAETPLQPLHRRDVYLAAMLHALSPVTGGQLNWQIEELNALQRFQPDVAEENRKRLFQAAQRAGADSKAAAITDLWLACLEGLGLEHYILHPEELLDLAPEQAEKMLADLSTGEEEGNLEQPMVHLLVRKEAAGELDELLESVGPEITLRGLLLALTGDDLLDEIQPLIIRYLAGYLDQGLAAWHSADREEGFYVTWRRSAVKDPTWLFDDLADWKDELAILPRDPVDAVMAELNRFGLPRERWTAYLERLALELPGWSGMMLWRHHRPGYEGLTPARVDMMDYLAVRLVLERIFAQRLCRQHWQLEARLDVLRWYFRRRRSEFFVRHALYNSRLPEYLMSLAQRLVVDYAESDDAYREWQRLADMIWTWRHSPASDFAVGHSVHRSAWPLFRLAQHLGLCGAELRSLSKAQLDQVLSCLDVLTPDRRGGLWLQAYERHYREQLFNALANNHGRGRWLTREERPEAQLVFCMDDREEGIRRHLEEGNPHIETLGAAGFFGVAINWRGLDDTKTTALCPIVVTPAHEVHEVPRPGSEARKTAHDQRRGRRIRIKDVLHQEIRRNLVSSAALIALAAPAALVVLAGKILAPFRFGRWSERLRRRNDRDVPTQVAINAKEETPATPEQPRRGFTDSEQADRVQGFLRTIGLTSGFAPLVVMMGHGSGSENNPHLAAYDCGACSGRHGGPNARVFAAMANRPEVRAQLAQRGMPIAEDTWFLGAEHDTCDEAIGWYDMDAMPERFRDAWRRLEAGLDQASRGSAHERCRRLASAPAKPTPARALRHVIGRALDFSQARPELGHATNAAAVIGRRAMTQGAFFDRRVFLISYDPTQDPEGEVLEAILLAVGPVGAGINLEYYFSTVNNERYGCGSKITHNITGLFGVMDGTSSDLRTGLPKQMIEIHEAMRLLIVVEARTDVLGRIYERQPVLQALIGNAWVLLAAKDPDSGDITLFKPGEGFVPWEGKLTPLPKVARSLDWYAGHHDPLAPALIETREAADA